jgi:L-iditol 2-dehydrogenase
MNGQMRGWKIYAPGDIRLETVDIPQVGAEDVLLKVDVATTCGTDLKIYRRGHPGMKFPNLFGHEVVGWVVEKGEKVSNVAIGDRVAAAANGAYAEYVLVRPPASLEELAVVPDGVPSEAAALTEPFACAYHGTVESHIKLGDQVVVLGCGPIGLMFVRLAKMSGAYVIATDTIAGRLESAKKVGADALVNISQVQDPIEAVKAFTDNKAGVDVAIEAVGLPAAWEQAIYMIRPGGLVTFFGGCKSGSTVTFDTTFIHYQEAHMQGIFNYHHPEHFFEAFRLIRRGALDTDVFISDHARLEDTEKVYKKLLEGYEGIKIAIHAGQ